MVEQYITWLHERGFHSDDLEDRGFSAIELTGNRDVFRQLRSA